MENQRKSFNAAMASYFIIVTLFVVFRLLSSFGLLQFLGGAGDYVWSIVIQIVLLLGGSIFLYSAFKKQKPKFTIKEFGMRKVSGKVVWLCIALGFVVFFINLFVSSAFNGLIELLGYEHNYSGGSTSYSFGMLIVNLIFTAVLPGICEEVAHRGMLLKSLTPLGTGKAIFLSALFFGLLHINIEQFFYATIIGLFLGVLTIVSGSIIPAMIVHFMNNALSVYLSFSAVNGLPFAKIVAFFESAIYSNIFLGMLIAILLLLGLSYLAIYLTKKVAILRLKDDLNAAQNYISRQIMRDSYMLEVETAKLEVADVERSIVSEEILDRLKDFIVNDNILENKKFKMPIYGKILLFGALFMGVVLTIFTFVWGVL